VPPEVADVLVAPDVVVADGVPGGVLGVGRRLQGACACACACLWMRVCVCKKGGRGRAGAGHTVRGNGVRMQCRVGVPCATTKGAFTAIAGQG